MPHWSNWSGRHNGKVRELHFVRSEADAAALVAQTARAGRTMRTAGAGHSHAPLVLHDDLIVDTRGLAGIVATDTDRSIARIRAGTRIHALGRPLHDAGLALCNQGDIDEQTIGGAVATGTHGTGRRLGNLSSAVIGAQVVLASGEIIDCDVDHEPDLFRIIRLNLGAVGLVTCLTLQLRPAYRLRETGAQMSWPTLAPQLQTLIEQHQRFEFFWYPHNDQCMTKAIDETLEPPQYPLAAEGRRLAWNYEVLPNHRPHRHTEMEYSTAADQGPACFQAIRDLLRRDFPSLAWPVEYRTVAADDVWLSMANGRDTVTISVHQDVAEDETDYYRACEAIFRAFRGRPHWGKMHYLDAAALADCHPHYARWWALRDRYDPQGVFLNATLRAWRP